MANIHDYTRWNLREEDDGLVTGACCSGVACSELTETACSLISGTYKGDHTKCDPNPCTEFGACCDSVGGCSIKSRDECVTGNSNDCIFYPDTPCVASGCADLCACCDGDSCTFVLTCDCCTALGYTPRSVDDTDGCDPNPCGSGVCCLPNGNCSERSEASCVENNGHWLGYDKTCEENGDECPFGACCDPDDGSCELTLESGCSGVFQGVGTDCDSVECPVYGACCDGEGGCTPNVSRDACIEQTGNECHFHEGQSCSGTKCDLGICCDSCRETIAACCHSNYSFTTNYDPQTYQEDCSDPDSGRSPCRSGAYCYDVLPAGNPDGQWDLCYDATEYEVDQGIYSGGDWHGSGTSCKCCNNPNDTDCTFGGEVCPCDSDPPQLYNCCGENGSCNQNNTEEMCTGEGSVPGSIWLGPPYNINQNCATDSPCTRGACCIADDYCIDNTIEAVCTTDHSGTFIPGGDCGTDCLVGACCDSNENCTDVTSAACFLNDPASTFNPGESCSSNPCASTTVLCCVNGKCQEAASCGPLSPTCETLNCDCDADGCTDITDI